MNEVQCNITFDNNLDKTRYFARRNTEYWLDTKGTLHEDMLFEINKYKIKKLCILFIFIIIGVFLILQNFDLQSKVTETSIKAVTSESIDTDNIDTQEIKSNIYDICSNEYLLEKDVKELCKQEAGALQLRFCINLMYARHGYVFKEGSEYDVYFNKQDWYQRLEKGNVTYNDLNAYERKNVDLIDKILINEGYRRR